MTRRELAAAMGLLVGRFGASAESNDLASRKVKLIRLPSGAMQPQAVRDQHGILHLVYYSGDPRSGDLFYSRSADSGAIFSKRLEVNAAGSAIAAGTIRGAQMAMGRHGRVHVAWNGSSQAQPGGPLNPESGKAGSPILYARLNSAATAFEAQRNVMRRSFGLDGGGSIAADSAGNVYVT
jgi:hypothetical protein